MLHDRIPAAHCRFPAVFIRVCMPVAAEKPSPARQESGDDVTDRKIPEQYLDGYDRILTDVSATGRRLTRDEIASRRALGEQAAEAGHGLRSLVSAHLAAARIVWPRTPGSTDSALAAVQQVVDAFAEGYERAQLLAVRQEEAARREFIDDLLYGRSDLGRLAERAERFGLRLSHAQAVAVAQGPAAYDEGDPVPRQIERALISRFGDRSVLLTTKDGRLLCIAPGHQDEISDLGSAVHSSQFAVRGHRANRYSRGAHRTSGGAGRKKLQHDGREPYLTMRGIIPQWPDTEEAAIR